MRVVHRLMRKGEALRQTNQGAAEWLEGVASAFEEILIEEGIIPTSHTGCFESSRIQMFNEMKRQNIDIENMVLADLGILSDTRKDLFS